MENNKRSRRKPDTSNRFKRNKTAAPYRGTEKTVSSSTARNTVRKAGRSAGRDPQPAPSRSAGNSSQGGNIVIQGSILAITSVVVRLIGMVYRIPLIRIVGNEGMGYYGTAFNVYSIMLLLSSYSLPLAVSKMIAARVARNEYRNAGRILRASLLYATVVGGVGAAVVWFGADIFANSVFKMPFCVYALKALAPTVWIMAYLGVFRGYFQGHGTMVPTALSQLFEQIVNAVISVGAAAILFKIGSRSSLVYAEAEYPQAFGAAGGTIGTGAGALTAFLFMLILIFVTRKNRRRQVRRDQAPYVESYGEITRILFLTVVPVILSTAVYNLTGILDNWIYGSYMRYAGQGDAYADLWGIYTGKYQLLINVPMAVSNALSSSLIPALSRAVSNRNRGQVMDKVTTAIRFAMIVAIPSTIGLTVLAGPVNQLLFDDVTAVKLTMFGSIAVVFYCMSTVSNAILQGINRMRIPIRNAILSLVIHIVALLLFLFVFKLGIYGVTFANIIFALSMCILNNRAIARYLDYRQEWKKTFIIPAIAAGIMGAAAFGTYKGIYLIAKSNLIGTLAAMAVAVVVYGVLLIKLKGIDEVELYGMPGGSKFVRIAHKIHLL